MSAITHALQQTLLRNTYWEWAVACAVALSCFAGLAMARQFARRYYGRMAPTKTVEMMEVPLKIVSKTASWFVAVIALAAGLATLTLPAKLDRVVSSCATIVMFLQIGVWASTALIAALEQRRRAALDADRAAVGSLGIIGIVLRTLIWGFVLLLTLDNLGIDVTTLVAGLGVGGIAVALAVQNVLGDLFASLSITLDKPFVVGDFLIVGDYLGTVEHIGIKSVRLRSLSGEQIILANTDVLQSRVRNYGRMRERRVVFTLGVTYETPREKLRKIPGLVEAAIKQETEARFDRSHFTKYGDFSLDFETVYYVLSADYNRYADVHQRINFAIHEAFEHEAIEFAYPTRKLWVVSANEAPRRQQSSTRRGAASANRQHTSPGAAGLERSE